MATGLCVVTFGSEEELWTGGASGRTTSGLKSKGVLSGGALGASNAPSVSLVFGSTDEAGIDTGDAPGMRPVVSVLLSPSKMSVES